MASRFLIVIALVPLGCVQGGQSAPAPAATAAPASAVEPAAAAPASSAAGSSGATPQAAPRVESARPAAPASAADASLATAPVAPAAKTAPARAPNRVRLNVPAGTLLPLRMQTTLSSATSKEGDPALAVLSEDVPLDGFKLDQGAEVRGRVLTAIAAKRVKGQARLVVGFDTVMKNGEKLSITTEAIDNMAASTIGKDKKIIAGGAVGGLIVGAIANGKKGAAIGTVVGAAAGTGAVLVMKGDEVELPRGAEVTVAVLK